jgi:hypothetical protein
MPPNMTQFTNSNQMPPIVSDIKALYTCRFTCWYLKSKNRTTLKTILYCSRMSNERMKTRAVFIPVQIEGLHVLCWGSRVARFFASVAWPIHQTIIQSFSSSFLLTRRIELICRHNGDKRRMIGAELFIEPIVQDSKIWTYNFGESKPQHFLC